MAGIYTTAGFHAPPRAGVSYARLDAIVAVRPISVNAFLHVRRLWVMHASHTRSSAPASVAIRGRGRPAGMTKARLFQRLLIAEAVFQGVRIASIARDLGVSRSWASREANAPGTRVIVRDLVEKRAEMIGTLIEHAFDVIEDAFGATRLIATADGHIEVPDHRIRLKAVGLFVRLVSTPLFVSSGRGSDRTCRTAVLQQTVPPRTASTSAADYEVRFEAVRVLIRMLSKM